MKNEKGTQGNECNRTVCKNQDSNYFNHSTRMFYCGTCANLINEGAQDYKDKTGHELCVRMERTPEQKTLKLIKEYERRIDRQEYQINYLDTEVKMLSNAKLTEHGKQNLEEKRGAVKVERAKSQCYVQMKHDLLEIFNFDD